MSNQVYSNNSRKFYALPGMNAYIMSGDVALGGSSGDAPNTVPTIAGFLFKSTPNSVINDDSIIQTGTSGFLVLKEGVYSILLLFGLKNSVNETTGDIDYSVTAELTRHGSALSGLILDERTERIVAPGATTHGSISRVKSISYVGYLNAGDSIGFGIKNYEAQGLTVLSNTTELMVNKIY